MQSTSENQNLLRSKFFKPKPTRDLVLRSELLSVLSNGDQNPIMLISAPSGYGKSTLVSSWLEQKDFNYGWISLSEYDNEWFTFIRYFVEGLKHSLEGHFDDAAALLSSPEMPDVMTISRKVINGLAKLDDDLYLVLDDYHFIHEKKIHKFIEGILRFPPPKFHLIIITRIDPPFKIQYFRTKHLITEVRARDLAFRLNATQEFLNNALGKTVDELACKTANEITEGWITGLRLISFKLKNQNDLELNLSTKTKKDLTQDLLEEIFIDFSPLTKEYVLKSSILHQFNISICDSICKDKNGVFAEEILKKLSASNLFILPVDNDKGWFRFHHLFQDYLRTKFEEVYSENEQNDTHFAAAGWLKNHGLFKEAIIHFLKSGYIDKAVEVFETYRHQLMNEARWPDFLQTFMFFDGGIVNSFIEIQLARAWRNVYEGKPFEMFSQLDPIKALIDNSKVSIAVKNRFRAELNCLLSYKTYNLERDYHKVIAQCDFALEFLREDQKYVKGYAWIFKLGALQLIGKYVEAKKLINENREEKNKSILDSHLFLVLNYLQWMEADSDALLETSEHLTHFENTDYNHEAYANGSHFFGIGKYLINDLESSVIHLQNSFDKRHFTIGIIKIMNSIALAFTHLGQNNVIEAERIILEIKSEFKNNGSYYFNTLLDAAHAEIFLSENKVEKALRKLKDVEQLPLVPFSNFYVPQFTLAKALIYSQDSLFLKKTYNQLKEYIAFSIDTHNQMYEMKFSALLAVHHQSQHMQKPAFRIIDEVIEKTKVHRLIRIFLDCGPWMKDLLQHYQHQVRNSAYLQEVILAFPEDPNGIIFTNRELDVLPLLNLPNKKIAEKLFIAEKTVKRHSNSIFKKLHVKNRREALHKAEAMRLV